MATSVVLHTLLIRRALAVLAALAVALAVACSNPATPTPTTKAPPVLTTRPTTEDGVITPILATTQLRVGTQRVAFLLATSQSLIKAPEATIRTVFLGTDPAPGEEKLAAFHLWPYGVRGAYAAELTFDRPGPWRLDIQVEGPDGPGEAQLTVDILDKTGVPDIGSIPPFGNNKTVHTVQRLEDLTTDSTPDPDLYQLTIAEAIITGRPTVIVFATPAFCTSPTCGPQVDTVSELKDLHQGEANFIHVELYDNPAEIQGDLSRARFNDLVSTWGLLSIPDWFNESWTFVLGTDGRITQRFEGFATLEELDAALQAVLTDV